MKKFLKELVKGVSFAVIALVLLIVVLVAVVPKNALGQVGLGTPIRFYASLQTCNSANNHQLIHVTGLGLYICDTSGNPGIWGPIAQANQMPAAYGDCATLDFAICTSSTSSGIPNILSAGSTGDITINAASLVVFINGQYQTGTGTLSNAITGLSSSTFYYVYVKQDVTNANFVAADFAATNLPPVYSYIPPSACTGASSTNPQYWFDMTQRLWQVSTAAACAFSNASPQVLFLGVAHQSGANATDGVAHEPYNLSPYARYQLFGDGFDAVNAGTDIATQIRTTGTTTVNDHHNYTAVELTGATLSPTTSNNNGTVSGNLVLFSQNPVLIINTSAISASGLGHVGGNGQTGVGSSGTNGGYSGSGGGGGGGSANAGGTGGGSNNWYNGGNSAGAPAGGGVNSGGTNGNRTPTGHMPFCSATFIAFAGGSGGGGGGDGTHAGGNGGPSGGLVALKAPGIQLDASSSITANGTNGSAAGVANAGGGGGGGGGTVILCGGYINSVGTTSANGGGSGAGAGTGGAGGTGANGIVSEEKLW